MGEPVLKDVLPYFSNLTGWQFGRFCEYVRFNGFSNVEKTTLKRLWREALENLLREGSRTDKAFKAFAVPELQRVCIIYPPQIMSTLPRFRTREYEQHPTL